MHQYNADARDTHLKEAFDTTIGFKAVAKDDDRSHCRIFGSLLRIMDLLEQALVCETLLLLKPLCIDTLGNEVPLDVNHRALGILRVVDEEEVARTVLG